MRSRCPFGIFDFERKFELDMKVRKPKLPLVGLPTCYYDLPNDDADKVVKGHRGGLRRLLEMELALARCEFNRIRGYYDELDMRGDLYLAGVPICVIGALGLGDKRLFSRILKDCEVYPERHGHPKARLAQEITLSWIRQFLRVGTGHPEWLLRMDLTQIPDEWKHQCAYLGMKGLLLRKDYAAAYRAASLLLNFDSRRNVLAAFPTYERLVCAWACHELGRKSEARRWFRQTVDLTCQQGIILPHLLLAAQIGPEMEEEIRRVSPQAAMRVRKMATSFFQNLIRFRNLFTGETMTTKLSPREFYIAQQLCDGFTYKEIAAKLGVSSGRVNNVVTDIYSKLNINGKSQLRKFVW